LIALDHTIYKYGAPSLLFGAKKKASLEGEASTKVDYVSEEAARIIYRINEFALPKQPTSEEQCEIMLVSYLQAFFPNIRRQAQYPDMRVDALIDKIGIEIKFQPSQYDFHALYSQIEDRLNYLDAVIVAIFNEKDRQATSKFMGKLEERGWMNRRVFVTSKNIDFRASS
jgi:hypothetical protein